MSLFPFLLGQVYQEKSTEKFGGQYDKDKVSGLLGLDTTQNLNISPKQRQEQEAAEKNKAPFRRWLITI